MSADTPLETLEALKSPPEASEYDQELGQSAGEDAMRVANGELSEEAFHERYDEAFREEFGDDYTPPEGVDNE